MNHIPSNSEKNKALATKQNTPYPKMYAILCAAASAAVDALPHTADTLQARCLLENALHEAEEIYLCRAE